MTERYQTLANEVDWLKKTTMAQGEKLSQFEIRLNKKHEEIAEIKQEETKKRERELQFLENMTKTSTLLDKVADTLDSTQKEINKIKEDVDILMNDNARNSGAMDTSKYWFGLLFSIIGGVIVFVFTNFIGKL